MRGRNGAGRTPPIDPFVQTALDGTLARPPTSVVRPLRNPGICRKTFAQPRHLSWDLRATPTSVIVIPNAAQRSEESKAHVLQTAFRGLNASDHDGGKP